MKRIAMFMPGGVGDVNSPVHIPALVNLVIRLSRRFDITVYSVIKPDDNRGTFSCGDAKVKFINARYDDHIMKRLFHFFMDFRHDHSQQRYDLVHGFWGLPCGFIAAVSGKIFGLPSIVSLQGGEAGSLRDIEYGDMRSQPLRAMTLWTMNNATTVTALTRFQLNQLLRFGFRRDDVAIIPHGVDRKFFVTARRRHPEPPYRFLHVGNLNHVKDQMTLLKAFHRITQRVDALLRIIGPDYLNGSIQQLQDEFLLEDKVEFLGHIPQSELPQHYAWADIFLLTSRYEAQGVVVAEAFASGTVVCGTNVGLIHDCDGDCTIAVGVGDDESLARTVFELLKDHIRYTTYQSNALEWSTQHDADWTAMEFVRLYDRLLDEEKAPDYVTAYQLSNR